MMHFFFVFLFVTQYFKVFHNVTLLLTDVYFFYEKKNVYTRQTIPWLYKISYGLGELFTCSSI